MPLYAQLTRAIQFAIVTGRLQIGEQLPTVRQLAVELRVNANTVAKVYAELERSGVLETRRGVGTFVCARHFEARNRQDPQAILGDLVDRFVEEAGAMGFSPDDLIARLLTQKLAEKGGRYIVENMPGASGIIGNTAAAKAAPDGCTLLVVNQNFVVQPAVNAKFSYDVPGSFAPVAFLAAAPETISVNPSVPAKTMQELIVLLKGNPGKYSYASPGYASSPHIAAERLFRLTHGLDVTHVPFQGGPPAVTSTIGGHTAIVHLTLPDSEAEAGRDLAAWREGGILRLEEPGLWWLAQARGR